MIILMNKKAKKEHINLVIDTLQKQNIIPIYIQNENAISTIVNSNSVDISSNLIQHLPGIDKIIDLSVNQPRIIN